MDSLILLGIKDGVRKVEKIATTPKQHQELQKLRKKILTEGKFKTYDSFKVVSENRGKISGSKLGKQKPKFSRIEPKEVEEYEETEEVKETKEVEVEKPKTEK